MNEVEMYKEFKQQCKMANIDSNEYINYLIMKALCEMSKPDIKLAEANAQIEYLSKKIVAQEQYNQELRDNYTKRWDEARTMGFKMGHDTGYDDAKRIYQKD